VVTWQPDDGRRRDQLGRKQDLRHLFRMVGKGQWRQAWRRVGMRTCRALSSGQVVQRFSR
jgi:hypothetical protein